MTIESPAIPSRPQRSAQAAQQSAWQWYHLLPLLAIGVYVFTPILSWKFGIPGAIRYAGDALVLLMMGLLVVRVLVIDRIPAMLLIILGISIIGAIVASIGGQEVYATLWGFWLLFRFPLVGLYVYRVPYWPRPMIGWIPKLAVALVGIQVLAQVALYALGEPIGDTIGGTLGARGTGALLLVICLMLSLALGAWLASGRWQLLALALGLGVVSSTLGEMKLFVLSASLLVVLAFVIHLVRGRELRRLALLTVLFVIGVLAFAATYNRFVAEANQISRLEEYVTGEIRGRYLNSSSTDPGRYRFDRNYGLAYAWEHIARDETSLLVGQGLGSRSVTTALGFVGSSFEDSSFGLFTGSSLVVIMMETGLLGLLTLAIFVVGSVAILARSAGAKAEQDIDVVRYGVILYSLLWPLWLWYNTVWILTAPAILYWFLWGVAMHYSVGHSRGKIRSRSDQLTSHTRQGSAITTEVNA